MMRWSRRRTSTSRWPIRPRATCKPSSTPQTQRSRASNCSWPWPSLSPSWESSSGPSASRWAGGCPAVNGRRHELSNRPACHRRHAPRTLRRRRPRRRPRPICGFHAPRGQRAPADRAEPGDDHPLGGGPIRHRDHPRDERDGIPLRCPSRDGLVGRIASFGFIVSMAGLFALATGLEGNSAAEALKASSYVQSVAVRLALGIGLFAFLSRAFAQSRGGNPETAAWTIQAAIFAALAAVVAGSLGTHAAGVPALTALGIAAYAAHFGGIGLWFAGLAGIVSIRRFFREPEAAPLARIVLGRFSRMAAYAVSLVLAGGIVLAVLLVGTLDALVTSPYGWVILAKVGLFAPMLALGAYNRYRLVPKTAESERPTEAVRRIVGNVRFETSLGIAVLVLAGLLTSMTPAAAVPAGPVGPFALDLVKDGLKVHSEVYPPPTTVGAYTLTLLLNYASNGTPFYLARNGTAQFTLTDPPRPPVKENLSGPHGNPSNHFSITTTALSSPGVWKIDLNFRRLDSFDLRVTFYVTIKAGG